MKPKNKLATALALIISLIHIVPFYLLITTSLKPKTDISSKWLLPKSIDWSNFTIAWEQAQLGQAFINNTIITVFSLILIIIVGACAAYPLSRYQTKLNKTVYMVFLSALILPGLTILVPLYRMMIDIHAMNTYWGVILLQLTFSLPMTIFLYTGFIGTIPRELDEAAMIDGMGRLHLFFRIILPLLKPITATVTIMTGVGIWNDYRFSLFFMQKAEMHTVTVGLASFFSNNTDNVGWVAAGSLIAALPLILLYLFLQRFFITGLASGAVKG
ncbi:carbohydrate ABC transporter permease [Paenibacillus sp. Soil724D2]|uniref:carbohydrate ABC transporter permease n=1 Tax=Paenibacillus sp. (strain Soil724D2) TaxID=1736392 RepID=UPI00071237A3|nr:carbohydrate ABC transporter permease [Paenibacillus sp. Soil724D2]KRE48419.1 maltose ABC transporter permease [Paenibacillus sp. Soil724D2]